MGSLTHYRGRKVEERLTRAHQASLPAEDIRASNRHVAGILGAPLPRYIKAKRQKRRGPAPKFRSAIDTTGLTFADAREWCGLPPAERDPRPALPCGTRDVASQFVGLRISGSGVVVPNVATPVHEAVESADTLARLLAQLAADDVKALAAAICAPNFSKVGEAFGFDGKTAERRGKAIVIAAAKTLSAVLEKNAA